MPRDASNFIYDAEDTIEALLENLEAQILEAKDDTTRMLERQEVVTLISALKSVYSSLRKAQRSL